MKGKNVTTVTIDQQRRPTAIGNNASQQQRGRLHDGGRPRRVQNRELLQCSKSAGSNLVDGAKAFDLAHFRCLGIA